MNTVVSIDIRASVKDENEKEVFGNMYQDMKTVKMEIGKRECIEMMDEFDEIIQKYATRK